LNLDKRVYLLKKYKTSFGNYPVVLADWLNLNKIAVDTTVIPVLPVKKFTRYLCLGSTGEYVSLLQEVLIKKGFLQIDEPTGNYGSGTFAAVKKFQSENNIKPTTGCVGSKTREMLNKQL